MEKEADLAGATSSGGGLAVWWYARLLVDVMVQHIEGRGARERLLRECYGRCAQMRCVQACSTSARQSRRQRNKISLRETPEPS